MAKSTQEDRSEEMKQPMVTRRDGRVARKLYWILYELEIITWIELYAKRLAMDRREL